MARVAPSWRNASGTPAPLPDVIRTSLGLHLFSCSRPSFMPTVVFRSKTFCTGPPLRQAGAPRDGPKRSIKGSSNELNRMALQQKFTDAANYRKNAKEQEQQSCQDGAQQQILTRLQADRDLQEALEKLGALMGEALPLMKRYSFWSRGDCTANAKLAAAIIWHLKLFRELETRVWIAKWRSVSPTLFAPLSEVGFRARVRRVYGLVGGSFWHVFSQALISATLRVYKTAGPQLERRSNRG